MFWKHIITTKPAYGQTLQKCWQFLHDGLVAAMQKSFDKYRPRYIPVAYKLAAAISVLIIAGMGLLGIVIVSNQAQLLREQMDRLGFTLVTQLADSSKEMILSEDRLVLRTLVTNLANSDSVRGVALFSESGEVLFAEGHIPVAPVFSVDAMRATVSGQPGMHIDWTADTPEDRLTEAVASYTAAMTFRNLTVGYALVSLSRMPMLHAIYEAQRTIIIATILMSLLAIITAVFMSRHLSRPIQNLMAATQAIDQGRYDFRIQERRDDEIGHLITSFNNMADGLLRKSQVESVFSRYVSKNIASEILKNLDQVKLGGRRIEATVLFADIVGFTSISESMCPDEVSRLLNEYFSYISLASKCYRGSIDKFIGDCAMVVFGINDNNSDHLFNAVACGVLIQKLMLQINAARSADDTRPVVRFRIGINSGEMLAGNLGSDERLEYTVVGDAVNLASRLSAVADAGQVVIREELFLDEQLNKRIVVDTHRTIRVRGKKKPITTFNVLNVTASYRTTMKTQLDELMMISAALQNQVPN